MTTFGPKAQQGATMADQPTYDPVRYLDLLLEEWTSRETLRIRRNLAVLAFAIIMVQFLGVPLGRLSFGEVPILMGKEIIVVSVAGVLLAYWGALFAVRYRGDLGRGRERAKVIKGAVQTFVDRREQIEAQKEKRDDWSFKHTFGAEYDAVSQFLDSYESQANRTKVTRFLHVYSMPGIYDPLSLRHRPLDQCPPFPRSMTNAPAVDQGLSP